MLRPTLMLLLAATAATASEVETSAGPLRITEQVAGLDEPWAFAFLPEGGLLITERAGRVLWASGTAATARVVALQGGPTVFDSGQGGLLDILLPRDFATSREVWLTFAVPVRGGAATAVGRGWLWEGAGQIERFQTLFQGDAMPGGRHFGSRLVEAANGTLFLTTGDRGTGPKGLQSQDPMRAEGKVIHLNRDGTPATSLPGHLPGVYSLGHRNAQGASLGPDGALWLVEHGAQGGDEVNRIEAGRNYGWPLISYGINYNGDSIGLGTARDGLEQPLHHWDPSIAPSGLMAYSGAAIPGWQGDLFTGSLKFDYIARLDPEVPAATGMAEERITAPETGRVRDVRQGPDGAIWFLSVTNGALYRMAPATDTSSAPISSPPPSD